MQVTSASLSVLIACDGGREVGLGHLARALAVAEEAVEQGHVPTLLIPAYLQHHAMVSDRTLKLISYDGDRLSDDVLAAEVPRIAPEVLHVDSYSHLTLPGFIRTSSVRDGAFGHRPADLVIDGTLNAELMSEDDSTRHSLKGADAVLLRREVLLAKARERPFPASSLRILVVMGGTDPHGATSQVLSALDLVSRTLHISVVGGASHRDQGRRQSVTYLGLRPDLPTLVCEHDLVISAAGTTLWELAYLNVPAAIVCTTENQIQGYEAWVSRSGIVGLGSLPLDLSRAADRIERILEGAGDWSSHRDFERPLVDGLGAWRVVRSWSLPARAHPVRGDTRARLATLGDATNLWSWRNDPHTRRYSRHQSRVSWNEHQSWLAKSLGSGDRYLLMVEHFGTPLATARWDRLEDDAFEISINVDPRYRGVGLGRHVILAAHEWLAERIDRPTRVIAAISKSNSRSAHAFARAGYLPHRPTDAAGFETMSTWLFSTDS